MEKISVNADFFETINTEEKAYWLGFIFADGYVAKEKPWFVVIQSIDFEHLQKFADAIQYTGTIKRTKGGSYEGSQPQGRLVICRKKMCQDIEGHGRYKSPMVIPDISHYLIPHFIRGYFDGDGSVYMQNTTASNKKKSKYKYLASQIIGEKHFLSQVQDILSELTITTTWKNSKTEHMKYLCINGGHNLRKLHKYMYSGSSVSLDRKAAKWQVLYGPSIEQSVEQTPNMLEHPL